MMLNVLNLKQSLRGLGALVTAVALLVAAGCGGLEASVSGVVKLDGAPLTKGDVAFHPVGKGTAAYGVVDGSGKYQLSTGTDAGLLPGDYVVTVVVTEEVPLQPGAAPLPPKVTSPIKYSDKGQSPLRVTVKAGSNDIPLELSAL
ncbi:hypothetical protein Psta_3600 [Pirellula staleyi DSM 6068]|uniref:Carboxypeptidase regulatory-like domain-containing protein n=1 Tax=Pirellula staleyi (strain ATCC 27377 / DSM 6068 / ICPB 4128) TaxID=530564 RepID=D2QZ69_PIRSD|nr:hypothetical protein [Pirellula staleyi]ADB18261.1 hypothetical protein Psta_3600 [Pirellula staleyi DSM 6068]